jgi:hypothetical protein
MRKLNRKDFNWKNNNQMIHFINGYGLLYNRFKSRLETSTKRKCARVIKHMRNVGLIPTVGLIQPTDKISIGSYIEDIEEMHKKTIDPITGRLFVKYSVQDDLKEK